MSIAFIADAHIGNHVQFGGTKTNGINARCGAVLNSLAKLAQHCAAESIQHLFIAGDLFDVVAPSPQVVTETMYTLKKYTHTHVYILPGNHDRASNARGDYALGPLAFLPNVTVVDDSQLYQVLSVRGLRKYQVITVPYLTGSTAELLPVELQNMRLHPNDADERVLVIHAGIIDEHTPVWLRKSHDAITASVLFDLMERYNIDWCFAGNWHTSRTWARNRRSIVQCGAFVPTGFDNPGMDYGYVRHFAEHIEHTVLCDEIDGPRFLSIDCDTRCTYSAEDINASNVFLKLVGDQKNIDRLLSKVHHERFIVAPTTTATPITPTASTNIGEAVNSFIDGKTQNETLRALTKNSVSELLKVK